MLALGYTATMSLGKINNKNVAVTVNRCDSGTVPYGQLLQIRHTKKVMARVVDDDVRTERDLNGDVTYTFKRYAVDVDKFPMVNVTITGLPGNVVTKLKHVYLQQTGEFWQVVHDD